MGNVIKKVKAATRRARAQRRASTDAETVLWRHLRSRQVAAIKFRRQEPFGPYILDFCCMNPRLAIEVDGSQHADDPQMARDRTRTKYFEAHGFSVLRFDDRQVLVETEAVVQRIWEELGATPSP